MDLKKGQERADVAAKNKGVNRILSSSKSHPDAT